jgi:hypothetical protein
MLEHHRVHPHFATYFRKTKLSDETFFQTLAVHYSGELNGTGLMFANWSSPTAPHPSRLTVDLLVNEFKGHKFFFARKFSSSDAELISAWVENSDRKHAI